MGNLEFKSAICTSVEQSKRLLELGLKMETADCALFLNGNNEFEQLSKFGDWERYADMFPAWSLHRLMEIAYKGDILGRVTFNFHETNIGAYYEQVIKVIEHLIRIKEFNKDYLEEKL